jgi:hypothetical protein
LEVMNRAVAHKVKGVDVAHQRQDGDIANDNADNPLAWDDGRSFPEVPRD